MTEKETFIDTWDKEFKTTLKVLKAFPVDKLDLKPSDKSKSARDLAWTMIGHHMFVDQIVKGQVQPGDGLPAPATMKEILATAEKIHPDMVKKVKNMSDKDYTSMIKFFAGPGKMSDTPRNQALWAILFDHIHHRGQFSVYLRLAGGKLPSIYGPTADEPWM